MRKSFLFVLLIALCGSAIAAPRGVHVITFGKVLPVKLFIGPNANDTVPLKIRSLYVDGKLKEFTTGPIHDVTDRLFVVRRAFRLNNNLPDEDNKVPDWVWQQGGWLLVDRLTGRVSQVNLQLFDPFYSHAEWFRDYAAYCGLSDDGEILYAMVMQLGNRKPIVKKKLGNASNAPDPSADCEPPNWQKAPTRVTFSPKKGQPVSFSIFGHAADIAPGSDEE